MNPLAIKASISAIIVLGAFYGGYKAGSLSGEADVSALEKNIAIERLAMRELLNKEVADNDLLKDKIRAHGIENQKVIDAATRRNTATRVFLPAAMCADYGSPDAATGSEATVTGAGILPEQVGGAQEEAQRALDEFNEENDGDAVTMEDVLNDICRPATSWVRGQ